MNGRPASSSTMTFAATANAISYTGAEPVFVDSDETANMSPALLEHALGVKLFERTSRTVRLTTAGQVFLTDATRLLNLAKQAAANAQRTRARFASIHSSARCRQPSVRVERVVARLPVSNAP